MCFAIPGKVIEINEDRVIVDYGKEKREVKVSIINVKEGDYVIVSNKIIVQKIPKDEALRSLEEWKKIH